MTRCNYPSATFWHPCNTMIPQYPPEGFPLPNYYQRSPRRRQALGLPFNVGLLPSWTVNLNDDDLRH